MSKRKVEACQLLLWHAKNEEGAVGNCASPTEGLTGLINHQNYHNLNHSQNLGNKLQGWQPFHDIRLSV